MVRHSGAERVALKLERRATAVTLTVRDDGVGLTDAAHDHANGIRGMRERALLVGAQLSVQRAQPRGTEVVLRIPPGEMA